MLECARVKLILHVPYSEKDEAKALGARWNPDLRTWYVPDGDPGPPERFDRWLPKVTLASFDVDQETGEITPKKKVKKPRVDSFHGGRTGPRELKEGCACEVLPWEECEHTR